MKDKKKPICTIPARAGSKRLPGKNLLSLNGKPTIAYSIEIALQSNLFEDVYVCTEDEKIASVSQDYGAKVPFLIPPELCGDFVGSHVPCQKMADFLINQGQFIETLVCLQPTSPLRSIGDLQQAVDKFINKNFDFLVSITHIDSHYFHWAVIPRNDETWRMYFGDRYMMERSLLPKAYRPNGSIKIANLEKLKETGHFFGSNLGVIETPEERSIHIGTKFDFELCEFLLQRK